MRQAFRETKPMEESKSLQHVRSTRISYEGCHLTNPLYMYHEAIEKYGARALVAD